MISRVSYKHRLNYFIKQTIDRYKYLTTYRYQNTSTSTAAAIFDASFSLV